MAWDKIELRNGEVEPVYPSLRTALWLSVGIFAVFALVSNYKSRW